jgi:hypothetical protein
VAQELLHLRCWHPEVIERETGRVAERVELAGADIFLAALLQGLNGERLTTALVAGIRDPDRSLLVLLLELAIVMAQVVGERLARLRPQLPVVCFAALGPWKVDGEPRSRPGQVADAHGGHSLDPACSLEGDGEQGIVAPPGLTLSVDLLEPLAHLDHLKGLRSLLLSHSAPRDGINRIVPAIEAHAFGVGEETGDHRQALVIGRSRERPFVPGVWASCSCPVLHDEQKTCIGSLVGEIHKQVVAVGRGRCSQGEGGAMIRDMRLQTSALAGLLIEPSDQDAIVGQADQVRTLLNRTRQDLCSNGWRRRDEFALSCRIVLSHRASEPFQIPELKILSRGLLYHTSAIVFEEKSKRDAERHAKSRSWQVENSRSAGLRRRDAQGQANERREWRRQKQKWGKARVREQRNFE